MIRRNSMLVLMFVLVLAALPALDQAQAQGRGKRGAGPDGRGLTPWCPVDLNLTDDQSAKLQGLHNAFFTETTDLRSDIFKKEQEFDALMLTQDPDAEKAKKLQDELSALYAKLSQMQLQAQLDSRKVLTPEQIAKLPPGCNMGFGCGPGMGRGKGCGWGRGGGKRCGMGGGRGPGGW